MTMTATARQTVSPFLESTLFIFRFLPFEVAERYLVLGLSKEHIQVEPRDSQRAGGGNDRTDEEDERHILCRAERDEIQDDGSDQQDDVRINGDRKALFIAGFDGGGERFARIEFTADIAERIEVEADVMLKGTRVDGIYTADPEKDPTATKFDEISYDEIYTRGLKVMDLTATTLCKENKLPIIVFDMDTVGNLARVLAGETIGTLVSPGC